MQEKIEHLQTQVADLHGRVSTLETKSAVDSVHRENVEKRLTGIESNLGWVIRLILGAIIAAAVTFALSGGFSI